MASTRDFPRVPMDTGRHATEWFIEKDLVLAGEVDLESARPPRLAFYGEAKPIAWKRRGRSKSAGFPQDHTIPELVGRLRTGHDVVATDAHVSVWLPERSKGSARFAVVGLQIAKADRRYPQIRLQITGADELFGIPPLKSIEFPDPQKTTFDGHWGATLNEKSVQEWKDEDSSLTIACSYQGHFSLTNRYRNELLFAPVVEFEGEPATVDQWMDQWIRPLLGLAALATRSPQRLSSLTVHTTFEVSKGESQKVSGTVFGAGIWQEPYQADEPPVRPDPDWKPLFTLKQLKVGLPAVLRRWRQLQASDNPFLELYRSVLVQPDLPPRARFLYLIQALEGLHGFEHKAEDQAAQTKFEAKRQTILDQLTEAKLPSSIRTFIKRNWSPRRSDSLDRRLRELIDDMRKEARAKLEHEKLPLADELKAAGATRLEEKLRWLRNDLSHGNRHFHEGDLEPWVALLEQIAQYHLVIRLGIR